MSLGERIDRVFRLSDPVPDAILIENEARAWGDPNVFYVTGVESGTLSGSSVVLVSGERPVLVTSLMEAEGAGRARDVDVVVARNRREHDAAISELFGSRERIGYNPRGLSSARFRDLAALLARARWVDVSTGLTRARLTKDADEIRRLREAARITSLAVGEVPGLLKEGIRERELAAELNYRLQTAGATGFAFDTLVAFGPNSAEPHHAAGEAALASGSLVVADAGARYRRYCGDLTRTYTFGKVGETELRMHAVVIRAQEAAIESLTPGRPLGEVHAAAERVIDRSEFRGRFVHAAGHSVGLEAQDGVVVHSRSDVAIGPGMVFAIEPGIYVPGVGGVRVEDTVLVTDRGAERLTRAPRGLVGDRGVGCA